MENSSQENQICWKKSALANDSRHEDRINNLHAGSNVKSQYGHSLISFTQPWKRSRQSSNTPLLTGVMSNKQADQDHLLFQQMYGFLMSLCLPLTWKWKSPENVRVHSKLPIKKCSPSRLHLNTFPPAYALYSYWMCWNQMCQVYMP